MSLLVTAHSHDELTREHAIAAAAGALLPHRDHLDPDPGHLSWFEYRALTYPGGAGTVPVLTDRVIHMEYDPDQ